MNESTFSFLRDALAEAYYLVERAAPEDFSGEKREEIQYTIADTINALQNRLTTKWDGSPSLWISDNET